MPKQKPKKVLSVDVINKLISDYQSGLSLKETCKLNGISLFYGRHYLKSYIRTPCDQWKSEVVEKYMSGETCTALAEKYDLYIPTVRTYLESVGAIEERKRITIESYQPVIEDYKNGLVQRELAEKYSQFSKGTIHHIVDKYCQKRNATTEEIDEYEMIDKLPKAEVKAKIRVFRTKEHVYKDIFDLVAGV